MKVILELLILGVVLSYVSTATVEQAAAAEDAGEFFVVSFNCFAFICRIYRSKFRYERITTFDTVNLEIYRELLRF
jgi:hypothetical protein